MTNVIKLISTNRLDAKKIDGDSRVIPFSRKNAQPGYVDEIRDALHLPRCGLSNKCMNSFGKNMFNCTHHTKCSKHKRVLIKISDILS